MRLAAVLLAALLLAGCSGDPAPQQQDVTGEGEAARESVAADRRKDNRTVVWDHIVVWSLDADPPATTMAVPANVTDLSVGIINIPTGPCGVSFGSAPPETDSYADFTSPDGSVTRVRLFANECKAGGVVVYSGTSTTSLGSDEAGDWQVSFSGRGLNMEQRLVVEGERVLPPDNGTAPVGNATR